MKKTDVIKKIAKKSLGFRTLETRKNYCLDARSVYVWDVKAALEAAYEAGRMAAKVKEG
jgi:hypothetical protein